MLIEDYVDGRNQLFAQFGTILPDTSAIIGEELRIVYQGVTGTFQSGVLIDGKEPVDKFFVRVSQQTALEQQANLTGNDLKRRYTTDGLIFAQIYSPKADVQNYALATKLAALIKTAFRGKQTEGCIWFNNVRIRELPAETAWYRLDVVAEYQYDEIG